MLLQSIHLNFFYSFWFITFSLFIILLLIKWFIVDSNKCWELTNPTKMRVIFFQATGFLATIHFYLNAVVCSLSSHLLFIIIRSRTHTHTHPLNIFYRCISIFSFSFTRSLSNTYMHEMYQYINQIQANRNYTFCALIFSVHCPDSFV